MCLSPFTTLVAFLWTCFSVSINDQYPTPNRTPDLWIISILANSYLLHTFLMPALRSWKHRNNRSLTCFSSNWSPPKAATQGLIPPVPKAIRLRPNNDKTLKWRGKDITILIWSTTAEIGCTRAKIPFTFLHISAGTFHLPSFLGETQRHLKYLWPLSLCQKVCIAGGHLSLRAPFTLCVQ